MYQYPLVAINMSNNSNKSQVSQSEVWLLLCILEVCLLNMLLVALTS